MEALLVIGVLTTVFAMMIIVRYITKGHGM